MKVQLDRKVNSRLNFCWMHIWDLRGVRTVQRLHGPCYLCNRIYAFVLCNAAELVQNIWLTSGFKDSPTILVISYGSVLHVTVECTSANLALGCIHSCLSEACGVI